MQNVIGIDEAGYSPLLGPLVVSAAHFEAAALPADWWASLGIPRAGAHNATGRVGAGPCCPPVPASSIFPSYLPVVDDSKQLYSQATGPARLELAVLAFLSTAGCRPADLRELLAAVGAAADVSAYPWYRGANPRLPVAADPADIARSADALHAAFEHARIRFAGFRSAPLLAGEYNEAVDRTGNKSTVLFQANARLIDAVLGSSGDAAGSAADAIVLADKHGGRKFYGDLLAQHYFGARIVTGSEKQEHSAYALTHGGRRIQISFHLGGDAIHLPIALASMCSKYIRELFMGAFNEYWAGIATGIPRTSGYRLDGRRFIESIQHLPQFERNQRKLVRTR